MTIGVHLVLICVVGLSSVGVAIAQVPPPNWNDDLPGEGTLSKQPVSGAFLGATYVEFEKTTLRDVIRLAGVGTIERQGGDGNSISYICFTDDTAARKARLWLVSNVMGGPNMAIVELSAVALGPSDRANDACPRLPNALRPVRLDRGVWIGGSERSLRQKFGEPSIRYEDWAAFNFIGQRPGTYRGEVVNWDVMSILSVKFGGGRVTALRANKLTSY